MRLAEAFLSPEHKRRYVRHLFDRIADRYDLITVVLSFGRDRAWKRRLVREACVASHEVVLDLACGTGDLAFEAAARGARVVGLDIAPRMVARARARAAGLACRNSPRFVLADMTALPFPSGIADVVTTGYGLRNVPLLDAAIAEIARVLKPQGRLLVLDFHRPEASWIRAPFLAYLTAVGSILGWVLHRDPDTYRYIPASLRRYPGAHGVAALLERHGFGQVRVIPLFGGLLAIHAAVRSP